MRRSILTLVMSVLLPAGAAGAEVTSSGQELNSRSRAKGISAGFGHCPWSPAHSQPRSGRCATISGAIALLLGMPNYYSADRREDSQLPRPGPP